jgi:hypothetical protein
MKKNKKKAKVKSVSIRLTCGSIFLKAPQAPIKSARSAT